MFQRIRFTVKPNVTQNMFKKLRNILHPANFVLKKSLLLCLRNKSSKGVKKLVILIIIIPSNIRITIDLKISQNPEAYPGLPQGSKMECLITTFNNF